MQLANARRHGRSLLRWFTQIRGGHEYKPTFSNAGSCSKWGRWGPGEPTPFGKARVSPSRIQTQQHALTPVAGLIGQERDQAFIGNQWEQLQNEPVSQPKHQPATSSRSDAMRWALRRRINLSRGSLDEPGRWPRRRRCRFCARGSRAASVPAPVPSGASRRVVRRMSEPGGIQGFRRLSCSCPS